MVLTKFDKVVTFMNSFLPFVELHAPDNNYVSLPASLTGNKVHMLLEGDYTSFIGETITLFDFNTGSKQEDILVSDAMYDGTFYTYIFIDAVTTPVTIAPSLILIKNEDVNGILDELIATMAYQMAIRFNIVFGMTLDELKDESNYDDMQLSIIAQMCCVYYLQRTLQGVIFNGSLAGKLSAKISDSSSSNTSTNFFTYLKKAKADVTEIEYGALSGQDIITSKMVTGGISASIDSAGFTSLLRNLMSNLHRMANQTMVDNYDFMIDYTWDDAFNDSYVISRYSTRHDDLLIISMN